MKYLIVVLLIFSPVVVADLNIKKDNVHENYSETVKVSGKYHMGIQFSGHHDFENLYVDIPEQSHGILCINLASINGSYKAQLSHAITPEIYGRTKINFTSEFKDRISSLQKNEMSVLATLGENCESKSTKFIIASWAKDTSHHPLVFIIRSGARIDVAHIPSIKKSKYSVKCEKFKDTNSIAFDKFCKFENLPADTLIVSNFFGKTSE